MVHDFISRFKLLAVTKGHNVTEIATLLRENPSIFRIGENRIDEAELKFEALRGMLGEDFNRLEKHFIGKLQSRKIREVARLFDVVQSVENEEQARRLAEAAGALGKSLKVFIEVNLSDLEGRSGVNPDAFDGLKAKVQALPELQLVGVMGMATRDEFAGKQFKLLKSLQGELSECSMGMSNDYPIAMEEGSTMLRLGTLLFEEGLPKNVKFE